LATGVLQKEAGSLTSKQLAAFESVAEVEVGVAAVMLVVVLVLAAVVVVVIRVHDSMVLILASKSTVVEVAGRSKVTGAVEVGKVCQRRAV